MVYLFAVAEMHIIQSPPHEQWRLNDSFLDSSYTFRVSHVRLLSHSGGREKIHQIIYRLQCIKRPAQKRAGLLMYHHTIFASVKSPCVLIDCFDSSPFHRR